MNLSMHSVNSPDPIMALRSKIINTLSSLELEHEWITTEQVKTFIELKYHEEYSLSKIGNNLRVLRECRVVDDSKRKGVRFWKLTGSVYDPEPQTKLLVSFPEGLHEKVKIYARQGGMSKNAFVISLVARGVKRLPPLKDPNAGMPSPPENK